jgi:hypothetical protein
MELQQWLIIFNIIATIGVGFILRNQIISQKTIIDKYKDFVSVIDPKTALHLKDKEIEQIKKNMSNDILTLQTQLSEMSNYVNYVINYLEQQNKEIPINFNKDVFITENMPSCRNILNSQE